MVATGTPQSLRPSARARAVAALALGGLVVAVLAGCGGSSTLSAKQWRTKADAVCTRGATESQKIGSTLGSSPTSADLDKALEKYADLLDKEIKQIADLEEPASLHHDVEAMLASLRTGGATLRKEGAKALTSAESPLADASKKARALGLKECGASS